VVDVSVELAGPHVSKSEENSFMSPAKAGIMMQQEPTFGKEETRG